MYMDDIDITKDVIDSLLQIEKLCQIVYGLNYLFSTVIYFSLQINYKYLRIMLKKY